MRLSVLGEGARPDVFTFNSIMHGMASVGECERLLSVLDEMKEAGVPPDVVSYNTAMGACNKVGWGGGSARAQEKQPANRAAALFLEIFMRMSLVCCALTLPGHRVVPRSHAWYTPQTTSRSQV